jgi:hypothetical protein
MKQIISGFLILSLLFVACNPKEETKTTGTTSSSIDLPYKATYATEFTNNVSDSELLTALNTYKYWAAGDIKGLRSTMGDSMEVEGADGFRFHGLTDSLMPLWQKARDSMSSVVITMEVWLKNHSVKDSLDYINTWYKEIDTYKTGRVDSAEYEDDNGFKNGKINYYSSHKQVLK